MRYKKFYLWLLALVILTPLGLLATGYAWGEWASNEVKKQVGFTPQGMKAMESIWSGFLSGYNLPDYLFSGRQGSSFFLESIGYIISAILGVAVIFAIFKLVSFILPDDKEDNGKETKSVT